MEGYVQVLTPADDAHHINKHNFQAPFVCGCRDLGEALRRVAEGAAMIRTKVGWSFSLIFADHVGQYHTHASLLQFASTSSIQ